MNEKNNENDSNESLTVIPPNTPEIHATFGATVRTPFNIRLILFNDEIIRNGEHLSGDAVPAVRNAKCELVLHPQVAENVANLLLEEVEKYKKDFCTPAKEQSGK